MNDAADAADADIELTPARLRRLLDTRVLAKSDVAHAFDVIDPRSQSAVWQQFAMSVLPCVVAALAVAALGTGGVAVFGDIGVKNNNELVFIALFAAVAVGLLVAIVRSWRKLLAPSIVFVVVAGILIAADANAGYSERELVEGFGPLALLAVVAWAVLRSGPAYLKLGDALPKIDAHADVDAARTLLTRPSLGARIATVALWVAAAIGVVVVIGVFKERSAEAAVAGGVLLVASAVLTRLRRTFEKRVLRQAGIALGVFGALIMVAPLMRHLDVPYEVRDFVPVGICALAFVLVSSAPWRVVIAAVAAFTLLMHRFHDVEKADDVAVIVLCIVTTMMFLRGRLHGRLERSIALSAAVAALLLAAVEVHVIAGRSGLGLGGITSIGATVCAVVSALVVLRSSSASTSPRIIAAVAGVFALTGWLFLDNPAILVALLVAGLARHARERAIEFAALSALAVFVVAAVAQSWRVSLAGCAVYLALAAVAVVGAMLLLRRLPVDAATSSS